MHSKSYASACCFYCFNGNNNNQLGPLVRVSLAGSGGVWGWRGVPPARPPEPGFSPLPQSNLMVPVLIGCPPGKRLALDITYTLQYNRVQNKHYFDCVKVDPEMPCFLFRDSACPAPSPLRTPPPGPSCLPAHCPHPSSAVPLGPFISPPSPLSFLLPVSTPPTPQSFTHSS